MVSGSPACCPEGEHGGRASRLSRQAAGGPAAAAGCGGRPAGGSRPVRGLLPGAVRRIPGHGRQAQVLPGHAGPVARVARRFGRARYPVGNPGHPARGRPPRAGTGAPRYGGPAGADHGPGRRPGVLSQPDFPGGVGCRAGPARAGIVGRRCAGDLPVSHRRAAGGPQA